MAMMNVNQKVHDQFYRYKMPKLQAKVEGKGNGIKTVIVNMVDIAKAIYRPPGYPTKFFGCELGAQTQIDKKNDRFIVNGSHSAEKLQDILQVFVEKFVLCEECENPETTFIVQPKKEKITSVCTACGHQGLIDMRHRLSTFILKNPPLDDSATPQKLKKAQQKQAAMENGDNSPDESGFDGWSDDVEVKSKADVDDWAEDTSEEAVAKRMQELGDGIKGLTHNDDLEKSVEERFNIFFNFVKNKINSGLDAAEEEKSILGEAERLDIKDRAPLALAELLFNKDILAQIQKYRILFLRFLANNQKAQKSFMGAFELVVSSYMTELLPKVAHILKMFYDCDYVEEEVILEWDSKVSKKYVKKDVSQKLHDKAKPFTNWLRDADEESEEEEEEDVEVVYTHRDANLVHKEDAEKAAKEEAVKNNTAPAAEPEEDDDLDIDDI